MFAAAVAMSVIGAAASLLRGARYVHTEVVPDEAPARAATYRLRSLRTAAATRRPDTSAPWIDAVSRWSPATYRPSPRSTGRRNAGAGRRLGQRVGDRVGRHVLPRPRVDAVDDAGMAAHLAFGLR